MLVAVSQESHRAVSVAAWTDPVGDAARRRNRRWLRRHVASGRLIAVVPPNLRSSRETPWSRSGQLRGR